MQALAVIPARYASERLPGKPILERVRQVTGKYLIQHVYERVCSAETVAEVIVATDDRRISEAVERFGGRAMMTSPRHRSGTDRVAEVARGLDYPIVVNVQGDEPGITPGQVDRVVRLLEEDGAAVMGTLAHEITDADAFRDPSCVKVVVDVHGTALYFSRAPLPHVRGDDMDQWVAEFGRKPLRHIGIYSFRNDFLLRFPAMKRSSLESAERLEQLRVLEAGYRIKVALTETASPGIDTPDDLRRWLDTF